jgi:predicted Zn finger-like uncharacterized protein
VIIACPSCGARFNLDPAKLLPAGRNVRCAKCDHRWRQMPEGPPPAAAAPEPPPAPPPSPPTPGAAPPEEAETHPPSPPETPAEMAQSLAAIAEQVSGAGRAEGYAVSEAGPQGTPEGTPGGTPPGTPGPEPSPLARLARRSGPGVGPITVPPRMKPMRPARRSSRLGLILLAGLIIGVLIAGYVFRDVIARSVPGADVIYSLFNLAADDPAADLDISVDDFDLRTDAATGQKVFDLWGTVFNKSYSAMDLPPLMVVPVDEAGSPMEPLRFRLVEPVIEPGQNIKFRKSFDNWPPTAPNFEIKVADAK